MSADNGVYILKTKDQYRVSHFGAVGNLYYHPFYDSDEEELSCLEIVMQYGDVKYTRKKSIALYIASHILENLSICEYGINFININKNWKQISKEAKEEAKEIVKQDIIYYGDREKLKKVANGDYISKRLSQKENKKCNERD